MNSYSHKTKIALVTVSDTVTQAPPLSILCLSKILEDEGYDTEIVDLQIHPEKENKLLEEVGRGEYLWIGFTAMTPSIPLVIKKIKSIRGVDSHIPIVIGGVHASALPRETLEELDVDAVCVGEGEEAVLDFSQKVRNGLNDYWSIPGVASLDSKGVYRFMPEMSESRMLHPFPTPNWEKIDINDYQLCPMQYVRRGKKIASIIATKGCPNMCSFCAHPALFGRKLIKRPPKEVVDEIEYLVRKRGVDEIHVMDDTFNCDLSYAKEILSDWANRNIQVRWKAVHGLWIHSFDDEWFSLLKRTGCYQVGFGIESGVQSILDNVKKPICLQEIGDVISKYKNCGISTFGFFILGLPGETDETIDKTIRFACELPLDHIHVSVFTPYPGSPLYDEAVKEGKACREWEKYYHYRHFDSCYDSDLTLKQLRKKLKRFYCHFYSKPSRAFGLAKEIRRTGLSQFFRIIKKIYE
jgi:anaerobic magnesium-protoporphyrin IX monomethyl ester cyclase